MRTSLAAVLALLFGLAGCPDSTPPASPAAPASQPTRREAVSVTKENLGKRITLEGRAVDAKLGAELIGDGFSVWIDGLDSWPDGYWSMAKRDGTRVRVSGVLAEDHATPVFVQKEGEPIRSGVPVVEGTDLDAASHRFVLKDATWESLEK